MLTTKKKRVKKEIFLFLIFFSLFLIPLLHSEGELNDTGLGDEIPVEPPAEIPNETVITYPYIHDGIYETKDLSATESDGKYIIDDKTGDFTYETQHYTTQCFGVSSDMMYCSEIIKFYGKDGITLNPKDFKFTFPTEVSFDRTYIPYAEIQSFSIIDYEKECTLDEKGVDICTEKLYPQTCEKNITELTEIKCPQEILDGKEVPGIIYDKDKGICYEEKITIETYDCSYYNPIGSHEETKEVIVDAIAYPEIIPIAGELTIKYSWYAPLSSKAEKYNISLFVNGVWQDIDPSYVWSGSGFLGTHQNTTYDTGILGIRLIGNLDWEYPNSQGTSSLTGMNMSGNVVLLHMNKDSTYGENTTLVFDFSGSGNNATIGNFSVNTSPNWTSSGKLGAGAYTFDSLWYDYINLGRNNTKVQPGVNNWTVAFWFKKTVASANSYYWNYMDNSGNATIGILTNASGCFYGIYRDNVANSLVAGYLANGCIVDTNWHHVVWTKVNTTLAMMYVDNVNIGNGTSATPVVNISGIMTGAGDPNNIFWGPFIGPSSIKTAASNFTIDEFAMWNRSLSAAEILNIYNYQGNGNNYFGNGTYTSEVIDLVEDTDFNTLTTCSNVGQIPDWTDGTCDGQLSGSSKKALYHFEGNLNDDTGNGYTGVSTGGVGYNLTHYKFGTRSGNFDGNDWFNVSSTLNFNQLVSGGAFTVAAWVYPTDNGNRATIFGDYDSGTGNGYSIILEKEASNDYRMCIRDGTLGQDNCINGGPTTINTWHYIVATSTGAGQGNNLYVDGIKIGSPGAVTSWGSGNGGIAVGRIGAARNLIYWKGNIDELSIWTRVITSAEINYTYQMGLAKLNISARSCDDAACSGESWTPTTIDVANVSIDSLSNNRYFQYKYDFTAINLSSTPKLYNVTLGYSQQFPWFENTQNNLTLPTSAPISSPVDYNTTIKDVNLNSFVFNHNFDPTVLARPNCSYVITGNNPFGGRYQTAQSFNVTSPGYITNVSLVGVQCTSTTGGCKDIKIEIYGPSSFYAGADLMSAPLLYSQTYPALSYSSAKIQRSWIFNDPPFVALGQFPGSNTYYWVVFSSDTSADSAYSFYVSSNGNCYPGTGLRKYSSQDYGVNWNGETAYDIQFALDISNFTLKNDTFKQGLVFQEFANFSYPWPEGFYLKDYGTYKTDTGIVNPKNCYDGSWTTYCTPGSLTNKWMYTNYTKPNNAMNNGLWQIKTFLTTRNLTMDSSCLSYGNTLQLGVNMTMRSSPANYSVQFYCYNGAWQNLYTSSSTASTSAYLYEEAMIWNISYGNSSLMTPTYTKTSDFIGDRQWQFCANDTNNNINCSGLNNINFYNPVNVDTTPPQIFWTVYPTGFMNGERVQLSGYTQDESINYNLSLYLWNSSIKTLLFSNVTTLYNPIQMNYNFNSTPYSTGTNLTFSIEATDNAGNFGSSNKSITVDHGSPILNRTWITPAYTWYKTGETVTYRINLTDETAGMNYVRVDLTNINGSLMTNMTRESGSFNANVSSTWNYTLMINTTSSVSIDGLDKIVTFEAYDNSTPTNNVANFTLAYSVDNNKPYYENILTAPTTKYAGNNVSLAISWNDSLSGFDSCILTTNASGSWVNYTWKGTYGSKAFQYCQFSVNYTTAGNYVFIFFGNDTKGNMNQTGEQNVTIVPATVPFPRVYYKFPPNNSVYSTTNFTVAMNVSNLSSAQLDTCWVNVNLVPTFFNSTAIIDIDTNFTVNITNDGVYSLDTCCNNTDGNYACSSNGGSENITVHTHPPYFTSIPANESLGYDDIWLGVDFDAIDDIQFDSYAINWTDTFNITKSTGFVLNTTSLGAGVYIMNITINDSANNLNSTLWRLTVTQSSPSLDLQLDGGYVNKTINVGTSSNVSCTSSSGENLNLTRDGVQVSYGSWANETNTLSLGYYNYTCIHQATQNYSLESQTLYLNVTDNQPPSITLWAPLNNSYNNTNPINFTANITDNYGLLNVTRYVYNKTSGVLLFRLNNSLFGVTEKIIGMPVSLNDGTYEWFYEAFDLAGTKVVSENRTLIMDLTAPTITILSPPTNDLFFNYSMDINYSYLETNPGTCWWTNDSGKTNQTLSCGTNITGKTWLQGINNITIYMNDTVGNLASAFRNFTVDNTNPNISLVTPLNNSYNKTNEINFTAVINDTLGLNNATLWVYNQTGGGLFNSSTTNLGGVLGKIIGIPFYLIDGIYNWFYDTFDLAGNKYTSENRTITIDTINPYMTILYPLNTSYNYNVSNLNYSYTEINCFNVWYSTDLGQNNQTAVNCGTNFTNVYSVEGSNTWMLFINDSAGNINWTRVTFIVDTITPSFTNSTPINLTVVFGNEISQKINASESVYWAVNDSKFTINQSGLFKNATKIGVGFYWINVSINDSTNNLNSTDFYVNITQATSQTSLTFNLISPQTYGTAITPTCSVISGEGTSVLTYNGTTIISGNPINLGAGGWNFTCTLASTQNYTASVNQSNFTITQASHTATLLLNGGIADLILVYPHQVNVSFTNTTGIANLTQDNFDITLTNGQNKTLGVAYYNFTLTIPSSQNYTAFSLSRFVNITQASSVIYTYLNNLRNNVTIAPTTSIDLNSTLITGLGNIQLYNNGSLINNGSSPLNNLTQFNNLGTYNITSIYQGNENYTQSSETWWVNVGDAIPPVILELFNLTIDDGWTGYSENGTWSSASNVCGYNGDYKYETGTAQLNATWTPNLTDNTYYNVYMHWCAHSARPVAVPVTIVHADGVNYTTVNQTTYANGSTAPDFSASGFKLLGTFRFDSTSWQYVKINTSSTGDTCADAVIFTSLYGDTLLPINGTLTNIDQNFSANITDDSGIKNSTLYIYNQTNGELVNRTTFVNTLTNIVSQSVGAVVSLIDGVYNWFYDTFDWSGNKDVSQNRTITIDKTSSAFQIPSNLSVPYLSPITADFNATDLHLDKYMINWTNSFTISQTGLLTNSTTLGVGYYMINVSVNDTVGNYNSTLYGIQITIKNQSISPRLNGVNANLVITYPQQVNVSFTGTNKTLVTLSINGTIVNKAQNYTWGAGYWVVNYSMPGNQNYSGNETFLNLTMNQAVSILNLSLNNTAGNLSISQYSNISLNCSLTSGDNFPITLYNNGTLINNGTSPIGNITDFTKNGLYNITCKYLTTQNYTESSKTWWLEVNSVVVDSLPPSVTITSPLNISYNRTVFFNATVTDANSSVDTCLYTLTNGATNYTMSNISSYFNASNFTMLEGNYLVRFYCNDSYNNMNDSETVNFTVDLTAPIVTIATPVDGALYSGASVIFNLIVSDVSPISSYIYSLDNNVNVSFTPNISIPVTATATHQLKVWVNDSVGNIGFDNNNFSFVYIESPAGGGGTGSLKNPYAIFVYPLYLQAEKETRINIFVESYNLQNHLYNPKSINFTYNKTEFTLLNQTYLTMSNITMATFYINEKATLGSKSMRVQVIDQQTLEKEIFLDIVEKGKLKEIIVEEKLWDRIKQYPSRILNWIIENILLSIIIILFLLFIIIFLIIILLKRRKKEKKKK